MKNLLILLFLSALTIKSAFAQEFKILISQDSTYSLQIPATWTKGNNFINKRIDLVAMSPIEPSDKVLENINTVAYPSSAASLDQFYQVAAASLAQSSGDWNLVSEGEIQTSDGTRALFLINTHNNVVSKQKMKTSVYFYHKEDTGIILTCTAIPDTFDAYQQQFEQIAKSFRWGTEN